MTPQGHPQIAVPPQPVLERRMSHQQQDVDSPSTVSKRPSQALQPWAQKLWASFFWLIHSVNRRRKLLAAHFIFFFLKMFLLCMSVYSKVGLEHGVPKWIFRLALAGSFGAICSVNFYCPGMFILRWREVGNLNVQCLYMHQGLVDSFKILKTKILLFHNWISSVPMPFPTISCVWQPPPPHSTHSHTGDFLVSEEFIWVWGFEFSLRVVSTKESPDSLGVGICGAL